MLLQQLLALKPAQVAEEALSERYDSSASFDEDMQKILKHLKDALAIIDSADFAKHVDDTENNFDVENLREAHDKMYEALEEAINASNDFYTLMVEAA